MSQLHTHTGCFTPWRDHQGDLIQIEFEVLRMIPPRDETVCRGV